MWIFGQISDHSNTCITQKNNKNVCVILTVHIWVYVETDQCSTCNKMEKTIAHTIHIHVLDWEAFVEFPYDVIPCTGTLFNNLKGVH